MIVPIFNPGTTETKVVKISVPHGNFSASFFNETSKQFESTNASILCDIK